MANKVQLVLSRKSELLTILLLHTPKTRLQGFKVQVSGIACMSLITKHIYNLLTCSTSDRWGITCMRVTTKQVVSCSYSPPTQADYHMTSSQLILFMRHVVTRNNIIQYACVSTPLITDLDRRKCPD